MKNVLQLTVLEDKTGTSLMKALVGVDPYAVLIRIDGPIHDWNSQHRSSNAEIKKVFY